MLRGALKLAAPSPDAIKYVVACRVKSTALLLAGYPKQSNVSVGLVSLKRLRGNGTPSVGGRVWPKVVPYLRSAGRNLKRVAGNHCVSIPLFVPNKLLKLASM